MAVNLIQVDTNSLKNTINNMNSDIKNLKENINQIYQDMRELDAMWDGPANNEFNIQFEKDRQDFLSICTEIEKYIDKIEYAKNEYDDCEMKVADIINAIRI